MAKATTKRKHRLQIELNKASLDLLGGLKKRSRMPMSFTLLANEAIFFGFPTLIKNMDKAGVLNGKK